MRQMTYKRRKKQMGWNAITKRKIEAGMCCEADLPGCQKRGAEGHHKKARSQGGEYTEQNHLLVCGFCHGWIERNPLGAANLGFRIMRKAI